MMKEEEKALAFSKVFPIQFIQKQRNMYENWVCCEI